MYVRYKGFSGDMPVTQQAWNTRIVVQFMNSAKGDLILDNFGNLTTRLTYDLGTEKSLPFNQHRPGQVIALIGRDGWLLTKGGAAWILDFYPPDSRYDLRQLSSIRG